MLPAPTVSPTPYLGETEHGVSEPSTVGKGKAESCEVPPGFRRVRGMMKMLANLTSQLLGTVPRCFRIPSVSH